MRTVKLMAAVAIAAGILIGPVDLVVGAATFYVDPVNGSPDGDGSATNPWRTIEEVINAGLISSFGAGAVPKNPDGPIEGGDTILLRSGYHGEIVLEFYHNRQMITIAAEEGHTPRIRRILVRPGGFWTFRGLTISPSFAPVYEQVTLVNVYSRFAGGICRHVVVEDCYMYSVLDTSGWTKADWVSKACNGINLGLDGNNLTARNNRLLNVRFGITAGATSSVVEYNEIVNFSGDGMVAANHNVLMQYNLVKNCYNVDANHDDGIQGYLAGDGTGQVDNVVLRGNVIINQEDPNQPHPGTLQGIGCFGGPYKNWLIENNVVLTNHWHGITLYNAVDSTVVNNTVFSKWYHGGQTNYQTWIEVTNAGGTNVVRNNTAHLFKVSGCVADHNMTIARGQNISGWFVDAANFNMRPIVGSPLIDAGTNLNAPSLDADELYRPMGIKTDIGAYEFGSIPPFAANAGADQTIEDVGDDGVEVVMLNASGSYSLIGAITEYVWTRDGAYVGSGAITPAVLTLGENTFTLRVTIEGGQQAFDEVTYTLVGSSQPIPGDVNGDGKVDLDDFVILKQNFGMTSGATWADGDLNGDGAVDLDDFVILKQNFGN